MENKKWLWILVPVVIIVIIFLFFPDVLGLNENTFTTTSGSGQNVQSEQINFTVEPQPNVNEPTQPQYDCKRVVEIQDAEGNTVPLCMLEE